MDNNVTLNNRKFGLTAFDLKIIAIIFMTVDHFTYLWYYDLANYAGTELLPVLLRSSGRFTFPIMVFMIAEGYFHTRNKFKYAGRLFVFSFISMYPFYLMEDTPWNVICTLFMGLFLLIMRDLCAETFSVIDTKIWTAIFLVISFVTSVGLYFYDWGFAGIFVIYIAGQIKDAKSRAILVPVLLFMGYIVSDFVVVGSFPPEFAYTSIDAYSLIHYCGLFFVIPLLLLYNGEKGYTKEPYTKYLFYLYYPLHILILSLIKF